MKPNVNITATRNGTRIVTGLCRGAFVNLFVAKPNPSGALKYGMTLLIEKDDPMLPLMKQAAQQAAVEKWGDKIPGKLNSPFRDGDEKTEYLGFAGKTFVAANSDNAPGVVNALNKPATPDECYSGAWYRVELNAFAYQKAGNQGVTFGLQNVQKLADDETFTGRKPADQVFGAVINPDVPASFGQDKAVDADLTSLFA